jgi:hypothetical protein
MREQEFMVQKIKQEVDSIGREMERYFAQAEELARSRDELSKKQAHLQQEIEKQQLHDREFQKGTLALFKQMQDFYQRAVMDMIDKPQLPTMQQPLAESDIVDIEELPVDPKKTVLMPTIQSEPEVEVDLPFSRSKNYRPDEEIDIFEIGK